MEQEFNECFHSRRRGRYARIFVDERPDRLWLYIGHGGLLRREAAIDETGPTSVCYRPEVYDAAVFVRATGELGIHARTAWETELYQRVLGKHLFGNEEFFGGKAKYSLDPLWEYGRAALQCIDVPEIEWALLAEVTVVEPHRPSYGRCESVRRSLRLLGPGHASLLARLATDQCGLAGEASRCSAAVPRDDPAVEPDRILPRRGPGRDRRVVGKKGIRPRRPEACTH